MKKANNQQNISQVPKKKQAEKSAIRRLVIDKKEFVKHNDMSNEIISYLKPIFEGWITLISWIITLYYNQSLYPL